MLKQGDLMLGGRYRIEGVAGEKKSCIVFKATRMRDGLAVAVKVLAPFVLRQPNVMARLRGRAEFALAMQHPNLIPVHEIVGEGEAFMVVESWIEAVTLLRVVRGKGACSPYEAAWLVAQLSRGVDHLIASGGPGFEFTLSDVYADIGDLRKETEFYASPVDCWPGLTVRLSPLALEGEGVAERTLSAPADSAQPLVCSLARIVFSLVTGGMGDPLAEPVLSEKFTASLRDCLTGARHAASCGELLWTLFGDLGPEVARLLPAADQPAAAATTGVVSPSAGFDRLDGGVTRPLGRPVVVDEHRGAIATPVDDQSAAAARPGEADGGRAEGDLQPAAAGPRQAAEQEQQGDKGVETWPPPLSVGRQTPKLRPRWPRRLAVATGIVCLALAAAWSLQRFRGRLNAPEAAGQGAGTTPPAETIRLTQFEFPSITTNGVQMPADARYVLHDRQDVRLGHLEISGSEAVVKDVPAALLGEPGRWPMRVQLESDRFKLDAVALEARDFQDAGGGRSRCARTLHLDPRPYLVIAPVIRVEGREFEIPLSLIKRHLHPADPSIDWIIEEVDGKIAITLPAEHGFPLKAVFALPCFEELPLDLPPPEPAVWELACEQRTVTLAGLGNGDQLQYEPDHASIDDPQLRELISRIVKPQAGASGLSEDGISTWKVPAIDGTVTVTGDGSTWTFPLAAKAKWKVLSDAARGAGGRDDDDREWSATKALAEEGEVDEQFKLGLLYLEQPHRNQQASAGWFQMAAIQGDKSAQHNLGVAYEQGAGVDRDFFKAARWFSKAADKGHADSQNSLALCYQDGRGVARDYDLAEKWFRRAVDQRCAPAMHNLAILCTMKDAGRFDESKAVELYRRAAELSFAPSQHNLAWYYSKGLGGLERDIEKAIELYREAAENGYPDAAKALEKLQGQPKSR